jgi:hypothetical protein
MNGNLNVVVVGFSHRIQKPEHRCQQNAIGYDFPITLFLFKGRVIKMMKEAK